MHTSTKIGCNRRVDLRLKFTRKFHLQYTYTVVEMKERIKRASGNEVERISVCKSDKVLENKISMCEWIFTRWVQLSSVLLAFKMSGYKCRHRHFLPIFWMTTTWMLFAVTNPWPFEHLRAECWQMFCVRCEFLWSQHVLITRSPLLLRDALEICQS